MADGARAADPAPRGALVLLCGLPGAGKSTLASRLLTEGPTELRALLPSAPRALTVWVLSFDAAYEHLSSGAEGFDPALWHASRERINAAVAHLFAPRPAEAFADSAFADSVRAHSDDGSLSDGSLRDESSRDDSFSLIRQLAQSRTEEATEGGIGARRFHVVVLDDNMQYRSMRRPYYRLARDLHLSICSIAITVPLSTALARNAARRAKVPEATLVHMAEVIELPDPVRHPWEKRPMLLEEVLKEEVIKEEVLKEEVLKEEVLKEEVLKEASSEASSASSEAVRTEAVSSEAVRTEGVNSEGVSSEQVSSLTLSSSPSCRTPTCHTPTCHTPTCHTPISVPIDLTEWISSIRTYVGKALRDTLRLGSARHAALAARAGSGSRGAARGDCARDGVRGKRCECVAPARPAPEAGRSAPSSRRRRTGDGDRQTCPARARALRGEQDAPPHPPCPPYLITLPPYPPLCPAPPLTLPPNRHQRGAGWLVIFNLMF